MSSIQCEGAYGVLSQPFVLRRSDRGAGSEPALINEGEKALTTLGIDIEATRTLRRRFACACVDWSERRPHIGGALGAALLKVALKRRWVMQDLDSRALKVTRTGVRELHARFDLEI